MPSLFTIKLFYALVIFSISLMAGFTPIRNWLANPRHGSLALGEALAAGIFLGTAFFHMLPDAVRDFAQALPGTVYPYANLFCALGFILLLFLERVILHYAKQQYAKHILIIPSVLTAVLSVHAISEGIALGVNTLVANTLIIFIAIMVHKSSECFALAASLIRSQVSKQYILTIFLIFSLMTPLGILGGSVIIESIAHKSSYLSSAIFNAFAAGTFLYIATLHNMHHKHNNDETNYFHEFILMTIGLAIMAVVAIWV